MTETADTTTSTMTSAEPSVCQWPGGCARPTAARSGSRGRAPAYCLDGDGDGPVHNPLNAFRAKAKPTATTAQVDAADAPRSTAVRVARTTVERMEVLTASMREATELLAAATATAADPEVVEREIADRVAEAAQEASNARAELARERAAHLAAVAEAAQCRSAAEDLAAQAEAAEHQALVMLGERDEARAALESAQRRIGDLEAQLASASQQTSAATERAQTAEARGQRLDAELLQAAMRRDEANAAAAAAEVARHAAEQQTAAAHSAAQQLQERLATADERLVEARDERDRARGEVATERTRVDALTAQLTQLVAAQGSVQPTP